MPTQILEAVDAIVPSPPVLVCTYEIYSTGGAPRGALRGVKNAPILAAKLNDGFAQLELQLDHYPSELNWGDQVWVKFPDGSIAGKWKHERKVSKNPAKGPNSYTLTLSSLRAELTDVDFNGNYTTDGTQPLSPLGQTDPAVWSNTAIPRTPHLVVGIIQNVGTSRGYMFNNATPEDAVTQHVLFGGSGWWWFCDHLGSVSVRNTSPYTHKLVKGRQVVESDLEEDIIGAINEQTVQGGVPPNGTVSLTATAVDTNIANPLSQPNIGRKAARPYTDTSLLDQASVNATSGNLLAMQEVVATLRTYRVLKGNRRIFPGESILIQVPSPDPAGTNTSPLGPFLVQEVKHYTSSDIQEIKVTDVPSKFKQIAQAQRQQAVLKLMQNPQRMAVSPDGSSGSVNSGVVGAGSSRPITPSSLTNIVGITTVSLFWNSGGNPDVYAYEVWEFVGASTAADPTTISGASNIAVVSSPSATLTGKTSGQTYTYWVRARAGSNLSGFTNFSQATPRTATGADIAVASVTADRIATSTLFAGLVVAGQIATAPTVDATHAGAIFDGNGVKVYDGGGFPRAEMGLLGANGVSPAMDGFRANDASGNPLFDSLGLINALQQLGEAVLPGSSPGTRPGLTPPGGTGYSLTGPVTGVIIMQTPTFSIPRTGTATILVITQITARITAGSGTVNIYPYVDSPQFVIGGALALDSNNPGYVNVTNHMTVNGANAGSGTRAYLLADIPSGVTIDIPFGIMHAFRLGG